PARAGPDSHRRRSRRRNAPPRRPPAPARDRRCPRSGTARPWPSRAGGPAPPSGPRPRPLCRAAPLLPCVRPLDVVLPPAASRVLRVAGLDELGLPGPAVVGDVPAPGREPAAVRHVDEARRRPADAPKLPPLPGLGQRVEQSPGVGG